MQSNYKDLIKFNVEGLNIEVSEEDKARMEKLQNDIDKFSQCPQDKLLIKCYPLKQQLKIFNELKDRQGQKTRLTFSNKADLPVEVVSAEKTRKDELLLNCKFLKSQKTFNMYLDTFISDAAKIKPRAFSKIYLSPVSDYVETLRAELNEIIDKYNKLYDAEKSRLSTAAYNDTKDFTELEKEGKANRYQMRGDEAIEVAKKYKGVEKVKNYWNTGLNADEKAEVIGWIANHIYSIRIYGVAEGKSGGILSQEYSDSGNIKLRAVARNDAGEITSQDSILGHISFKHINKSTAPLNILKKICTEKSHEDLFYENRLNDKNLALFLISEYHDCGFVAGMHRLSENINLSKLQEIFKDNIESFNKGYQE